MGPANSYPSSRIEKRRRKEGPKGLQKKQVFVDGQTYWRGGAKNRKKHRKKKCMHKKNKGKGLARRKKKRVEFEGKTFRQKETAKNLKKGGGRGSKKPKNPDNGNQETKESCGNPPYHLYREIKKEKTGEQAQKKKKNHPTTTKTLGIPKGKRGVWCRGKGPVGGGRTFDHQGPGDDSG